MSERAEDPVYRVRPDAKGRITLGKLAEGVSSEEILQDFPNLELQDIYACLSYAARRVDFERLAV